MSGHQVFLVDTVNFPRGAIQVSNRVHEVFKLNQGGEVLREVVQAVVNLKAVV